MKECMFVFALVSSLALGCMCMMPMMHRGHDDKPHKQEVSRLCECDCVEKSGECHCQHST